MFCAGGGAPCVVKFGVEITGTWKTRPKELRGTVAYAWARGRAETTRYAP
jgi:hypothetical protein